MTFSLTTLAIVVGFPAMRQRVPVSAPTLATISRNSEAIHMLPMPRRDVEIEPPAVGNRPGRRRAMPSVEIHPDVALDQFLTEVIEMEPGATIPVSELYELYVSTRRVRGLGWPGVSQIALTNRLKAKGCRRTQLDCRAEGKGRPIAYVMPGQMQAGVEAA